ncbi:MAG: SAM-dependent methyltransferase [Pseudomonadota bacterium]
MTALAGALAERIQRDGPLTLAAYMEACLNDPEHGYYRTGAPIGAAGDFITAPEISQVFGELLGLALAQAWIDQGQPAPFALVELGPGRGRLMADALRAARAAPGFLESARLTLVETSGPLRAAQRRALESAPLTPRWAARIEEIEPAPLFLLANEFFDALPIRQWRRAPGGWRERLIGLEAGRLAPVLSAAPADRPADQAAILDAAPEGAWYERCEAGEAIAAEIGRRLAASGGAALIIDYGYDAAMRRSAGWRETFQAARRHEFADPFAAPGEADLTAHVDFSALSAAAEAAGAAAAPLATQGAVLRALGAEMRAAALAKAQPDAAETVMEGVTRLIDPREMGALFKVLGLTARGAPPLAGFG